MYCGQCGKRVLDGMLFCPFCGAPIVIPEQGEPAPHRSPEAERREAGAAGESAPAARPEPEPVVQSKPEPAPEADAGERAAENAGRETEAFAPRGEEAAPAPPRKPSASERPASLYDDFEETGEAEDMYDPEDGGAPEGAGDSSEAGEELDAEVLDPFDEDGEPFAPLEIGAAEPLDEEPPREPPIRRRGPRRSAPPGNGLRANRTFIPVRDVNPGDMFMDHIRPTMDEFDPYDEGNSGEDSARGEESFSFEDAEPEGFVQRHIRGVVGLALLAVLLVVFLVWMMLPAGQRVLASANLAWNAGVYNQLGNQAYEAGQYRQAARDFERAFARDSDNYDYAHSAMVAYYEAGDTEAALAMLKRCIDMDPGNPDPYIELTILYPDPAARPWEVQQLLRQGYERTGEESLNVVGA